MFHRLLKFIDPENSDQQLIGLKTCLLEAVRNEKLWYNSYSKQCIEIQTKILDDSRTKFPSIKSLDQLDTYIIGIIEEYSNKIRLSVVPYTLLLANYYCERGYYSNGIGIYARHIVKYDSSHRLIDDGLVSKDNLARFGPYLYSALSYLYSGFSDPQKEKCKDIFYLFKKESTSKEWVEFLLGIIAGKSSKFAEQILSSTTTHFYKQFRTEAVITALCLPQFYEILLLNYECFVNNADYQLQLLAKWVIQIITNQQVDAHNQENVTFQFLDLPDMIDKYIKIPKVSQTLAQNKLTCPLTHTSELLISEFKTVSCTVLIDQQGLQFGSQYFIEFQENSSHDYVKKSIFKRIPLKFSKPNIFGLCYGKQGIIKQAKFDSIINEVQSGQEFKIIVYEKKSINEDEILIPVYVKDNECDFPITYPNIISFDYLKDDFITIKTKAIASIQNLLIQIIEKSKIFLKSNFELDIVQQLKDIIETVGIEFILKQNGKIIPQSGDLIDSVTNYEELTIEFILKSKDHAIIVKNIENDRLAMDVPFLPNNELTINEPMFTQVPDLVPPQSYAISIDPLESIKIPSKCRIGSKMYDLICATQLQGNMIARSILSGEYYQRGQEKFEQVQVENLSLTSKGYALYCQSGEQELQDLDIEKQIQIDELKKEGFYMEGQEEDDGVNVDEYEGYEIDDDDDVGYGVDEEEEKVKDNGWVEDNEIGEGGGGQEGVESTQQINENIIESQN